MKNVVISQKSDENELQIALFYACFFYVYDVSKFEEHPDYSYSRFELLCREHKIEKYAKRLYSYCVNYSSRLLNFSDLPQGADRIKITLKELAENYILISKYEPESSKYVLKSDNIEIGSITMPEINTVIKEHLDAIFRSGDYKTFPINMFDLAATDEEWVEYYCKQNSIDIEQYKDYHSLMKIEFSAFLDYEEEYEKFRQEKGLDEDFAVLVLNYFDEIHPQKRKKRTTEETDILGELANKLHYIILFDSFREQDDIDSIAEYAKSIKNEHAAILYDILKFFGHVEDKEDSDKYTDTKGHLKFIPTNLRRYRKRMSERNFIEVESVTDGVIDALWNIKKYPRHKISFNYFEDKYENIKHLIVNQAMGDLMQIYQSED